MKSFWVRNSCFTYLYVQLITLFTSKFTALHKKWSFPFRISSVNVTKSAVSLRIWSHLLKKSIMENFIICAVLLTEDGGLLQWPPGYYKCSSTPNHLRYFSSWNKITLKKYIKTKLHRKEITNRFSFLIKRKLLKNRYENDYRSCISEIHRKNMSEAPQFSINQNYIRLERRWPFVHENYFGKYTSK